MLCKPVAFSLIWLVTLALAAQESRNAGAQPPTSERRTASAPASPASDTAPPAPVRATMSEKVKDLASTDPLRVAAAAYWLGELGRAAAPSIPQLTAVLADNRHVDPARYRKHLAARAARPEVSSPGEEAAAALAKIGEPAVEALINVLKGSPNPVARQNAAWALGIIQGRHSTGALAEAEITTGTDN